MTPEQRSRCMSRIRSKDTGPEIAVRRMAHALGYRFRLHRRDLPGSPDLVFPRLRAVVFVHGCFWHVHSCQRGRVPKSNVSYWAAKRLRNAARDRRARAKLRRMGWRVLTVWECQLRKPELVSAKLARFLAERAPSSHADGDGSSAVHTSP